MSKAHVTLISLLLGAAVVLGVFAAIRTTSLAAERSSTGSESIAARQQRLDSAEAQLRRALARRPPALRATSSVSGRTAPRVMFVRSPSIAVTRASSDEHGEEYEQHEEESDD